MIGVSMRVTPIRILPESHPSLLRASVSLRPSLKTRRNDRIIKVERRALHGAAWRFDDALNNSEDSSTLNTSFIERLNLTIRQSSAYLSRRTLFHARSTERLDEHMELLRCYYNFVRPHGARAASAGLREFRERLSDSSLRVRSRFRIGRDRRKPCSETYQRHTSPMFSIRASPSLDLIA